MKFYAILNENSICIGISQLNGEVNQSNMIEIDSFNIDYMWKKYENESWSNEKFEPQTTTPLTEFEDVKKNQELMQKAIDDLILNSTGGAL